MPHTNRDELSWLFGTFCHLWTKGLHANVQMKTTGSGGVVAQFEFELDKPHKSFPAGLPGFRRGQPPRVPRHHPGHEPGSPNAPGHPGAVEAAAVGPDVGAQKRSSDLDCKPQLTRHRWQLLAALHQQHQYPWLPLRLPRLPSDQRQPG